MTQEWGREGGAKFGPLCPVRDRIHLRTEIVLCLLFGSAEELGQTEAVVWAMAGASGPTR